MQNDMQQTMIVTEQDAMRIHRANMEAAQRRQWDVQIRNERIIMFLAGAVAATFCAIVATVWK